MLNYEIGDMKWKSRFMSIHFSDEEELNLDSKKYSGVEVELVKDFEMGVSNKTPEFMKMNPIGKVPVLETPDGPVFESNAIARYVTRVKADNPLYGSSLIEYVSGVRIVRLSGY
nr:isoform 2 of elongation factor 1-gamma 2 [Quercus suber]